MATFTGNSQNNALFGGADNDSLLGREGDDILDGGAGNDWLDGGAGADTLFGGTGNDTYVVDDAGDNVIEGANEGIDQVRSSITYTLTANVEHLLLTGTENLNGVGNELNNNLVGNSGINALYGLDGHDTLQGFGGDDWLDGGNGNDWLDGGTGADVMFGGVGHDDYIVDNAADVVVEYVGEGTDTVRSSVNYTLGSNVENLVLTGSSNLNGTGNELDNRVRGNTGNNILDGGLGADTMSGGAGNDIYVVDNVGDQVIENAGEGTDLVRSSITHTLASNVENLVLTGTADLNGTGNGLNNNITGNSGNNVLLGLGGNDTITGMGGTDWLDGGDGNDWLDGGAGADTLVGGAGNDTFVVDNVGDVVVEGANGGTDEVRSSISYTLGDNVEHLRLLGTANLNATGNELGNNLVGNEGDNILDGKGGNDSLQGFGGSDTLIGGAGNDWLSGAGGADFFVFDAALGNGNVDIVSDFESGVDKLVLGASAGGAPFEGLSTGVLSGAAFDVLGDGTAATADTRIVYNPATGALFYDADGMGSGTAVQFATLSNFTTVTLHASDILVA